MTVDHEASVGPRLVFVLGAPRSGTTLLMRLLNAHPQVAGRAETHLLPPLAHLGYFDRVDRAPYDAYQAERAARSWVADLPGGEATYVASLRAHTDRIFGGLLERAGTERLVEKTPANALVWPFVTQLYPDAAYVVLTRHPFAVFRSFATSFFDDDWGAAHAHNRVVERYVPALGRLLRARPAPRLVHLSYEALVAEPEATLRRLTTALELPWEPVMLDYGSAPVDGRGGGDPVTADRASGVLAADPHAWVADVRDRPDRRALLGRMVRHLDDADLQAWGTPRAALWSPLHDHDASHRSDRGRRRWDRWHVERRVLRAVRANLDGPLGDGLRRARSLLDTVLRDG